MAKTRILIVEDESLIAEDIKTSLEELGYSVVGAVDTGEEAIRVADVSSPDLILMDIVLKGKLGGVETARRIISRLTIPIIYLTAHTEKTILKKAKTSGAYGYLVKPFKDGEMQAAIEMALYKYRMEEKLRQSESRLFTTLRSINDAVISTDIQGAITFMNPLAQLLTGYEISTAQGKLLHDIFIYKNREPSLINVSLDRVIKSGFMIEQAQCILYDKNNMPTIIELSSAPISDDRGTRSGQVIVFRDITKRIQIEKELAEKRKKLEKVAKERTARLELFSDIVAKSPDGVLIVSLEGGILYCNRAVNQIYGFSAAELTGKSLNELNDDPDFAKLEIIPTIKEKGSWEGELLATHKKGHIFPVWIAAFIVSGDSSQQEGMIFIIRDLTDRKKAEQSIRDSEAKFSNFFHHSSDAIFICSIEGEIHELNRKALEQFGYTRKELSNMSIADLHPPQVAGDAQKSLEQTVQDGHTSFEMLYKRKNGTLFPAEVISSIFRIGNRKVLQCLIRDITDRKLAEEKLKKYQEQLEREVYERTHELMKANMSLQSEILERKNIEKKLLDYQKQLQSLTSQLALFEENEKRRIATELHDCVGQTLALTKIKLGLLSKTAPTSTLKSSIEEIQTLLEQTIKETRTLTFELSPPILYELGLNQAVQWLIDQFHEKYGLSIVFTDDGHNKPFNNNVRFFLFQAIRELLLNIVKHAKASKVSINMTTSNGALHITVEDNGVGFANHPEKRDGFGLFNIRERMNHVNGQFIVDSGPSKGTRITIVAPFEINNALSVERS